MSGKTYKPKRRPLVSNAGVTATVSMALVLFLIGLLASALFLTRDMANALKEQTTLSLVLRDEAPPQRVEQLRKLLDAAPYAKSVTYISKEQALKEHIEALGENPAEFLGWNPLAASLEVKLNAEYVHNDSLAKIEQQLQHFETIEKVAYQKNVIAMVNDNVHKISIVLLGLAAVLALISLALINNTIRLRVYSNRFLINTMKLVGAKGWFIRKPYVRQSILSGIVAGVIALGMLSGGMFYMKHQFGLDTDFITTRSALIIAAVVLVSGGLLSAVSSYFAVGRYINMRTDEVMMS